MSLFGALECWIAWRFLRSKRREGFVSIIGWFSMLGITLGVATLIIVMSVMGGFRHDLFQRILGFNGHMTLTGAGRVLEDYRALVELVGTQEGVTAVAPLVEGQALLSAEGRARGVLFRGMRFEDVMAKPLLSKAGVEIDEGLYRQGEGVLVGGKLGRILGLRLGGEVTLVSPEGVSTAFGTVPRLKRMRVAGFFETGMYQIDSSIVLMTLETAQAFTGLEAGAVEAVELRLAEPSNFAPVRTFLSQHVEQPLRVVTWEDMNATLVGALKVERNVMFLILTLMILIAAFNIISGLVMMVHEKTRAIGTLRAMGLSTGSVVRIFMLAGSATGVLGTALGTVLGVAFCLHIETLRQGLESLLDVQLFAEEIYFLSRLPVRLEATEIVSIALFSLLASVLASLYPAVKAARVNPARLLRDE